MWFVSTQKGPSKKRSDHTSEKERETKVMERSVNVMSHNSNGEFRCSIVGYLQH